MTLDARSIQRRIDQIVTEVQALTNLADDSVLARLSDLSREMRVLKQLLRDRSGDAA